jgi:hypothetical protein
MGILSVNQVYLYNAYNSRTGIYLSHKYVHYLSLIELHEKRREARKKTIIY